MSIAQKQEVPSSIIPPMRHMRFSTLLSSALQPAKIRKKTHVPHGVIERRLDQKKHRGGLKKVRRKPGSLED